MDLKVCTSKTSTSNNYFSRQSLSNYTPEFEFELELQNYTPNYTPVSESPLLGVQKQRYNKYE